MQKKQSIDESFESQIKRIGYPISIRTIDSSLFPRQTNQTFDLVSTKYHILNIDFHMIPQFSFSIQ